MKSFIRLFLAFCLLLLCGHNAIYAHPHSEAVFTKPGKTLEKSEDVIFRFLQQRQATTARYSLPDKEHETFRIKATEVEEEDESEKSTVAKKHTNIRSYLATFFFTHTTGDQCQRTKVHLTVPEHSPFLSSGRYLVFGVFRI